MSYLPVHRASRWFGTALQRNVYGFVLTAKVKKMRPVVKSRPVGKVDIVLVNQTALDAAIESLRGLDHAFVSTLLRSGGAPILRHRAAGFEGLAGIVISQQVSTASAEAIFSRLKTHLVVIEAASVVGASDEALRHCGLSAPKVRTLRALGQAVATGALDFEHLTDMSAEAAHATLVAIKGIGPWTADVFLLFCLGHPDAWPAGDLALQEAARLALGLADRPNEKALRMLGERWRPWRGVAAYMLWASYRALRSVKVPDLA